MLASVIVRTMGRPSLAAALASVMLQRRDDLELIIVDARGDLPPLTDLLMPMRWVTRGQALHRSVAAQAGLDAVRTRWAMFLDDDDELLSGHLDKLVAALESSPDALLAHTGVELVGSGEHESRRGSFDQPFEPWELLLGNRMPIHAALFDAQRARAAGAHFDHALDVYEDWDFWLQLSMLGGFVHVPGVSARYWIGDDSSDAHHKAHGDEAYWRIWHKWWTRAPQSWWAVAFRAGATAGDTARHLAVTREDLARRLEQIHQLHADLSASGGQISELHRLLAERVQALLQAQITLGQTQYELTKSQATLGGAEAALKSTQAALESTQAMLKSTREAWNHTSQRLADTTLALSATQLAQQRSAHELQAMLHSTSWRVTSPLRDTATFARQTKARLARFKRETWSRQSLLRSRAFHDYQAWINGPEALDRSARAAAYTSAANSAAILRFSIVMPVYNPSLEHLDEALNSVLAQGFERWQLCIADDASTLPGVREHLASWATTDDRIVVAERELNGHIAACTNTALALATGEWVVFLDQDDRLAPHALAELADAITQHPGAAMIYSDEDKLDARARRCEPHFKPDFSIELLRGQNFVNHLLACRRPLLQELRGLRDGFEGAQDHDLVLRVAERVPAEQIVHVPRVLYHWRVGAGSTASDPAHKAYAGDAALRAVADHLARSELQAQVEALPGLPWLRVRYPVSVAAASVSMAAPVSDGAWLLRLQDFTTVAKLHDADELGSPWVLVLREGLWPTNSAWLDEMVGLLDRSGVGVVAGAVHVHGELTQGALLSDTRGRIETLCLNLPKGQPGPFGAARLVRGCVAVTPDAMLLRRELWPQWQHSVGASRDERALDFGRKVHAAAWRLVWTPFTVFDEAMIG